MQYLADSGVPSAAGGHPQAVLVVLAHVLVGHDVVEHAVSKDHYTGLHQTGCVSYDKSDQVISREQTGILQTRSATSHSIKQVMIVEGTRALFYTIGRFSYRC